MAAIDTDQMVTDSKLYLPDENVLTDAELLAIAVSVVAYQIPADDDTYYSEALCKMLRAVGSMNKTKAIISSAGLKRDKQGGAELEWFASGINGWDAYIDSLKNICPLFGYYGLSESMGIKVVAGDPVPSCGNREDIKNIYL